MVTGHLLHRGLDPELPATLSEKIVNGLLRDQLGFDGVVVSDDLDMAAVADHHALQDRIALALVAGVDLLLFGNNLLYDPDRPRKVLDAIVAAVKASEVSQDCLRQHAQRVDRLLERLNDKSARPR